MDKVKGHFYLCLAESRGQLLHNIRENMEKKEMQTHKHLIRNIMKFPIRKNPTVEPRIEPSNDVSTEPIGRIIAL